ncbi:hypothetical protein, partial [Zooshikella sp. RANM57]|uniref:hypothetical protein n=1 Tax=Zooshikella sp. RANM57 TaxID=3425863 RepID=UPI003D6F6682
VKLLSADGSVAFRHVRVGHRQALIGSPGTVVPGLFTLGILLSSKGTSLEDKFLMATFPTLNFISILLIFVCLLLPYNSLLTYSCTLSFIYSLSI